MTNQNQNQINYFENCQTIEQIKKRYRELAQQFHPDHNPTTDTNKIMAQINLQYEQFKNMKFTGINHETGKEYEQTFDAFDGYRELIDQLINLQGITIELCGTWLWITGDTKQHKELLKEIGLTYQGKKCAWYWHPGTFRKKSKNQMTMDDIRFKYGSQSVNNNNSNNKQQEDKQAIA